MYISIQQTINRHLRQQTSPCQVLHHSKPIPSDKLKLSSQPTSGSGLLHDKSYLWLLKWEEWWEVRCVCVCVGGGVVVEGVQNSIHQILHKFLSNSCWSVSQVGPSATVSQITTNSSEINLQTLTYWQGQTKTHTIISIFTKFYKHVCTLHMHTYKDDPHYNLHLIYEVS